LTATKTSKAWWGTVVVFLTYGLVVATWISRIPAVQSALRLNNFVLGLTLLSSAVGALCVIPAAGMLVGKYGSKRVILWLSTPFCLCLVLPSLAVNGVTLAVALFVYGAITAAQGVAMNSQAVEVERAMERPTMSRFHGMFSLGAMLGAAAGGAVAARGVGTMSHFAVSAVVNTLALLAVGGLLLDTHSDAQDANKHADHRLPFRNMPRVLLALSAICFCIFLSEGAMADWTALYLHQVLKAGQGMAATGYSVFSGAMATMRFLGDIVTARLGPMRAVRNGGVRIFHHHSLGIRIGGPRQGRGGGSGDCHGFGHRVSGVYFGTARYWVLIAIDNAAWRALGGDVLLFVRGVLVSRNEPSMTEADRLAVTGHLQVSEAVDWLFVDSSMIGNRTFPIAGGGAGGCR